MDQQIVTLHSKNEPEKIIISSSEKDSSKKSGASGPPSSVSDSDSDHFGASLRDDTLGPLRERRVAVGAAVPQLGTPNLSVVVSQLQLIFVVDEMVLIISNSSICIK